MNRRDLFLPKLKELKEQCPSCPFREDNDAEFGAVVTKLYCMKHRRALVPEAVEVHVLIAREMIKEEVARAGDFICHRTAYNEDMSLKPDSEKRQCPGATAYYKSKGPTV